jgi:hypothetical protein
MMLKGLLIAAGLAAFAATPAWACSVGKMRPAELRAEQTRDLREADLVFLTRVIGQGTSDDPELNVILFEPIERIRGGRNVPESLAVAVFFCLPPPPIGEIQVILMRSADVSAAPDRTSPVLGYYPVSDIRHSSLRQRVEWALQRANIQ